MTEEQSNRILQEMRSLHRAVERLTEQVQRLEKQVEENGRTSIDAVANHTLDPEYLEFTGQTY